MQIRTSRIEGQGLQIRGVRRAAGRPKVFRPRTQTEEDALIDLAVDTLFALPATCVQREADRARMGGPTLDDELDRGAVMPLRELARITCVTITAAGKEVRRAEQALMALADGTELDPQHDPLQAREQG